MIYTILLNSLVGVLVHACDRSILLQCLKVVVRASRSDTSVHLLESSQVHGRIEQREDVGVEGLPVRVVQVVLLRL